jgi:hypothetical protein
MLRAHRDMKQRRSEKQIYPRHIDAAEVPPGRALQELVHAVEFSEGRYAEVIVQAGIFVHYVLVEGGV